jgi:hypothetical protein
MRAVLTLIREILVFIGVLAGVIIITTVADYIHVREYAPVIALLVSVLRLSKRTAWFQQAEDYSPKTSKRRESGRRWQTCARDEGSVIK